MTLTCDAQSATVVLTRPRVSLALATAAFATELRNTRITVALREDYLDFRPSELPRGSTVLFVDYLRFQLLRYPHPPALELAKQIVASGHSLVVLNELCPRTEAALNAAAESPHQSFSRLLRLLCPDPRAQSGWLVQAADCISYDIVAKSHAVRSLISRAQRELSYLDIARCPVRSEVFVEHVLRYSAR